MNIRDLRKCMKGSSAKRADRAQRENRHFAKKANRRQFP